MPNLKHTLQMLVTLAALPLAVLSNSVQAQTALEPWKLEIVRDDADQTGKPNVERRLAVLVVDRSNSMQKQPNGDLLASGKESRWQIVDKEVERILDELVKASPGIELRIYFFDEDVDCLKPLYGVLNNATDADNIFAQFPHEPSREGNATKLYEAITSACKRTLLDCKQAPPEWLFFALFSDGDDNASASEFKDNWLGEMNRVKQTISRTEVFVVPVGQEADKMLAAGVFGPMSKLGAKIPKPPPPRNAYRLQSLPGSNAIATGILAAAKVDYSIDVRVNFDKVDANDLQLLKDAYKLQFAMTPPFDLKGSPLPVNGGVVSMQVQQAGLARAVAAGAIAGLSITVPPAAPNDATPILRCDSLERKYSFRPAVRPPNAAAWKIEAPKFIRINGSADFIVDLPPDLKVVWSFVDGAGAKEDMEGSAVSTVCKVAGKLIASVQATSKDGKSEQRPAAATVEVIDSRFTITGPSTAKIGESIVFTAEPVGPSLAKYEWSVNGDKEAGKAIDDRSYSVPFNSVGDVNINCTAKSVVGDFEWNESKAAKVEIAPKISIISPDLIIEGESSYSITCKIYGIDGKVTLKCGVFSVSKDVVYLSPSFKIGDLTFDVPAEVVKRAIQGEKVDVQVSSGAITESRPIPVQRANIKASLISPLPGSSLSFGQEETLQFAISRADLLENGQPNTDLIADSLKVEVIDASSTVLFKDSVHIEGAFKLKVKPVLGQHTGPITVKAEIMGARLLLPRPMTEIGTLEISEPTDFIELQLTALLTTSPGKPFVAKLKTEIIPLDQIESIQWSATDISSNPPDAGPAEANAIRQFIPTKCGNCLVEATVVLKNKKILVSKSIVLVAAEEIKVKSSVTPSQVTEGTKTVIYSTEVDGDFESYEVVVRDAGGIERRSGPYTASQNIEVDVSKMTVGEIKVAVLVTPYCGDSAHLIPFPEAELTVRIVHRGLWEWWIPCLAAMLGVAWLLWRFFRDNNPLRWEIEFGFQDPGPANIDSGVPLASLAIADSCSHPDGRYPAYTGWSRKRKEAFVPLWYLQDRAGGEDSQWLTDDRHANLKLTVKNYWAEPFTRLPSADQGWAEPEPRHPPIDGEGIDRISRTYRLTPGKDEAGVPRELWVRMKCLRGSDPKLWVLWAWLALTMVSSVILLQVFHIVDR